MLTLTVSRPNFSMRDLDRIRHTTTDKTTYGSPVSEILIEEVEYRLLGLGGVANELAKFEVRNRGRSRFGIEQAFRRQATRPVGIHEAQIRDGLQYGLHRLREIC